MKRYDGNTLVRTRSVAGLLLAAGGLVGPVACGGPGAAGAGAAEPAGGAGAPLVAKSCAGGKLDDLEDGDGKSNPERGRGGYWYTYSDKASKIAPGAKFAPAAPGAGGSKFAARMTGRTGGDDVTYAGMGFSLVDPKGPYDGSGYRGVRFRAKAGKGSVKEVRVKIPDIQTDPDGKVCKQCFNDFGNDLALSEDWKTFTLPFSAMKQEAGWGDAKRAIDTSKLYAFMVQVKEPNADFDVAVDDIEFLCE